MVEVEFLVIIMMNVFFFTDCIIVNIIIYVIVFAPIVSILVIIMIMGS